MNISNVLLMDPINIMIYEPPNNTSAQTLKNSAENLSESYHVSDSVANPKMPQYHSYEELTSTDQTSDMDFTKTVVDIVSEVYEEVQNQTVPKSTSSNFLNDIRNLQVFSMILIKV